MDVAAGEGPASTKLAPFFERRVFESPVLKFLAGPFAGFALLGGVGDAGADAVGDVGDGIQHFGAVEAFVADEVDDVPVDGLFGVGGECAGEEN